MPMDWVKKLIARRDNTATAGGPFFQSTFTELIESPNGSRIWWHSMPLPDGLRISGQHHDKDLQLKMWRALKIANNGGLAGRSVLDIGANDGFFSLAALMAGADKVTAIDATWETWPANIRYASDMWRLEPEIVTADFRTYPFSHSYDVIFFLGVLYHLEDVFGCMTRLSDLLVKDGVIYLETQMSQIVSDLPVFECASDIYPTIAPQNKRALSGVGIGNYLFPNEHAVRNLAYSYDFECEPLDGPANLYTAQNPTRRIFRLSREIPASSR
jgi:SAM-dependent methyltransferase